MNKTVFQKIIDREIPAEILYEDDKYLAILDIFPKSKGHTLVITKECYRWVNDVPYFGEYFEVAKKVALAVERALKPSFISYQTYGLEVPHAHIQIIPYYQMSEIALERYEPTKEELIEVKEMVRKELV